MKKTAGFTLIELLIVIAIIGILAAVLIPNLIGARAKAYQAAVDSCAHAIQTAQETYQIDNQAYASTLGALDSSIVAPCNNAASGITVTAGTYAVGTQWTVTSSKGGTPKKVDPSIVTK